MSKPIHYGLSQTDGGVAEHLVLDLLFEYDSKHRGRPIRLRELAEATNRTGDIPLFEENARLIIEGLHSRHTIVVEPTTSTIQDCRLSLTHNGRREAERARTQRETRDANRDACRHALLHWLDQEEYDDSYINLARFFTHPLSHFWGYPFEIKHFDHALSWLSDKGLVVPYAALGPNSTARITIEGADCVQQHPWNIYAYLKGKTVSGNQNIHVGGDFTGQLGVTGHGNVTQTQDQKVDIKKIMEVLEGVRSQIPSLGLEEQDAKELHETIDEIEEKGNNGTLDQEEKGSLLKRITGYLSNASAVLGPIFLAGVQNLLDSGA